MAIVLQLNAAMLETHCVQGSLFPLSDTPVPVARLIENVEVVVNNQPLPVLSEEFKYRTADCLARKEPRIG
ncbi:hypothetical protein D3C77_730370 [compost metagenome]